MAESSNVEETNYCRRFNSTAYYAAALATGEIFRNDEHIFSCFASSIVDRQLICSLCDKSMEICMYIPFGFGRGGIEFSDLGAPEVLFMVPPKIRRKRQTLKL